jgi:hypothetical protein
MAKEKKRTDELAYAVRRPGRPRKSESQETNAAPAKAEPGLRFEMRLPAGIVADLEQMQRNTGSTFAHYIRNAILRALSEDKEQWKRR